MIGMFDSGIGGLAVWELVKKELPDHPTIYIADQAYAPYGEKTRVQITDRAQRISRWLIERGAKLIVVACNTATVQAIAALRRKFSTVPFVGMEPAVKPAAAVGERILMIGTRATVGSKRYRDLIRRHAAGRDVRGVAVPELVAAVEAGRPDDLVLIKRAIGAELSWADSLVIGSTHLSFLMPTIARHWPQIRIFDGRYGAVAQVKRLSPSTSVSDSTQLDQFYSTRGGHIAALPDPSSSSIILKHLRI